MFELVINAFSQIYSNNWSQLFPDFILESSLISRLNSNDNHNTHIYLEIWLLHSWLSGTWILSRKLTFFSKISKNHLFNNSNNTAALSYLTLHFPIHIRYQALLLELDSFVWRLIRFYLHLFYDPCYFIDFWIVSSIKSLLLAEIAEWGFVNWLNFPWIISCRMR